MWFLDSKLAESNEYWSQIMSMKISMLDIPIIFLNTFHAILAYLTRLLDIIIYKCTSHASNVDVSNLEFPYSNRFDFKDEFKDL